MAGMIMDAVLMLLLVAAVGYGVKLERKLTALRAGQLAFAQAVTDLNAAAGRAEAALATLRASARRRICCMTGSSRPARSSSSWRR